MKILHLIGFFQPELGYKEYYIARNQVKLGHEVFIVTSDRLYPFSNVSEISKKINVSDNRRYDAGTFRIDGITVFRLPAIFEFHGAIFLRGVKKILREIQPDVVHAYEPVQAVPVLGACYKRKLGYALLSDHQQFEVPSTLLGKLYFYCCSRFLSRYMFQKADAILLPTDASKKFAIKRLGAPIEKCKDVPLGFDRDIFYFNEQSRIKMRKQLNIKDDELLLVTAGRITRQKKYELILKALKKTKGKHKYKYLLLGSGDQKYVSELWALAEELSIQDKFMYREFVPKEQLHEYYSASDVGIWPVQPSITIIEAIGCHLPVILPNRDTVAHLVQSGNGILFKEGDIDNLAQLLDELPNQLQYMREKAKYAAAETFDYRKIAAQIIEIAKGTHT